MYVCVCNALNNRDVEKAKCSGACQASEIHRQLGVRVQCGRCLPYIRQLLQQDEAGAAERPAVVPAADEKQSA